MIKLQELRVEKGISQAEIAAALGITQQAYSRYERGVSELGYTNLTKFANFFDVSIDYLLGNSNFYYPDTVKNALLSEDEEELVALYRSLMPEYKTLALTNLRIWAGKPTTNDLKKKA